MEKGWLVDVIATIKLESGFASQFHRDVVREITNRIKREAENIKVAITDKIRTTVREGLVATPEYQSVVQGKLRAELGIPNSDARIVSIVDTWVNNIIVKVKTSKNPFLSIEIGMIQDDYGDVLGTAEASYTTSKGRNIPWLEWLLIAGDKTLVADYIFTEDISTGISRTGLGLMRQKNTGRWHVPREFAGTATNNFVTRSLSRLEGEVIAIMQKEVAKRLK